MIPSKVSRAALQPKSVRIENRLRGFTQDAAPLRYVFEGEHF